MRREGRSPDHWPEASRPVLVGLPVPENTLQAVLKNQGARESLQRLQSGSCALVSQALACVCTNTQGEYGEDPQSTSEMSTAAPLEPATCWLAGLTRTFGALMGLVGEGNGTRRPSLKIIGLNPSGMHGCITGLFR